MASALWRRHSGETNFALLLSSFYQTSLILVFFLRSTLFTACPRPVLLRDFALLVSSRSFASDLDAIGRTAVPEHYRIIDEALRKIGQPPLPIDASLITLGSWTGGDRDGNPFVTHKLTKRIVALCQLRACKLYHADVEALLWKLSLHGKATAEVEEWLANEDANADPNKVDVEQQNPHWNFYRAEQVMEEPYRQVLVKLRAKLEATIMRCEEISIGKEPPSFITSNMYFKTSDELMGPLMLIYDSLMACGDGFVAGGALKVFSCLLTLLAHLCSLLQHLCGCDLTCVRLASCRILSAASRLLASIFCALTSGRRATAIRKQSTLSPPTWAWASTHHGPRTRGLSGSLRS